MTKDKVIKLTLIILVIIPFVITLPAIYSNSRRFNSVKKEAKTVLNGLSNICSNNCTIYPKEWVIEDEEVEAELYCMRQCANNMEKIKEEMVGTFTNQIFEDKYHYRVAQTYCILGLRCLPLEMKDFIYKYKE